MVFFLSDMATRMGLSCRLHTSSLGLSELLVAGGHTFPWLVTVLCQWAVFSWPTRLLSSVP